jgi:uncharacterized protein
MIELNAIKKTIQAQKNELKRKYGVTEIGIFGSYIKNTQNKDSDVDLLVEFEKAVDLITFVHIKNELSDLLNMKVDLIMKRALKPGIRKRILDEVISL